jgi:hypothetical protein
LTVFGVDLLHSVEGTWILLGAMFVSIVLLALAIKLIFPSKPLVGNDSEDAPITVDMTDVPELVTEVA